MNDRTVILRIRRNFHPGFGELVGGDVLRQARRQREEQGELAASVVLAHWQDEGKPVSMVHVAHHPASVEAPVALVAGRHSECELGPIPGASLRHALILLWPPPDEGELPSAEVIDLGTETGISLPGGELSAHVASSGRLRFAVADADVVVLHARGGEPLPLDPRALAAPPAEDEEREEVALDHTRPHTRHLNVSPTGELEEGGGLGDGDSCIAMRVSPGRGRRPGAEHSMLTQIIRLDERHVRARVLVRPQDLERGVRLGRYLRCRGASALGHDHYVSRVHALVLDRGGRRWLFDTASTNGTQVIDLESGVTRGPVRGERTFALDEGQAPSLAGQVALLEVGSPEVPS